MSRKYFVVIGGLSFLLALISLFFGVSIYNANENVHINHLNEMDHIYYYQAVDVPALSRLAAIVTGIFLLAITGVEIYIYRKTNFQVVKKIALGIIVFCFCVLVLDILTIVHHAYFDFSQWGFAWIAVAVFAVAGNLYSFFVRA
ncbi:MAG: hypothetical protein IPM74_11380 [Crocinitomicaceae bacterium]|nr:hypothetical protein [Crocinitomicaceae bacterium]MBK8926484.1 hypothetical protein [Crocinitomicaceae bacterium]